MNTIAFPSSTSSNTPAQTSQTMRFLKPGAVMPRIGRSMQPRSNPWEQVGRRFAPTSNTQDALMASGLNWQVEKIGLRTDDLAPVPDNMAIRRSDTGRVLGIVGADYEPLQNHEAFSFFQDVAGNGRLSFETAGCFNHGAITWVQAKLPDHDIRIGDDVSECFLFISNGHIGNKTLTIAPTTVRIICKNTLRMAEAQQRHGRTLRPGLTNGFTVKHTKNMRDALNEIRDAYAQTLKSHAVTKEAYRFLAGKQMRTRLKDAFFDVVFASGPDESERAAAIAKARRDRLEAILATPTSQVKGTRNTAFSLFQAAVEYIDHERSTRTSDGEDAASARLHSATFGSGAALKSRAWDAILDLTHA